MRATPGDVALILCIAMAGLLPVDSDDLSQPVKHCLYFIWVRIAERVDTAEFCVFGIAKALDMSLHIFVALRKKIEIWPFCGASDGISLLPV